MTNNLTKLPEKWCIIRNSKNAEILNKWNNDTYSNSTACMYSDKQYDSLNSKANLVSGYTEITFEQFKMWVLNKNNVIELW